MRGARSLTDSEISLVKLVLTNTRDYTLFVLGLKTGFRISELLSLKVSDVHQYDTINTHVTVSRRNMKGKHSSRSVILHPEAQQSLVKLINEYSLQPNDFLFQSRKGLNNPISKQHAWLILKTAYRACRLQGHCSTHSMRKSLAARVYAASDRDLVKTSKALGHANVSSTISYLDCNSEELDDLIKNLK